MEWATEHNIIFCREVLTLNPFKHRKGSTERGALWKQIATNLNFLANPKFVVTQRSVTDHLVLLQKKYRKKMRQEEQETGTSPEKTELDEIVEEINDVEETADAEQQVASRAQQDKAEQEKVKADDIRRKAMETLKETKNRNAEEDKENKNIKRKRRSGSETIEYLKEKFINERAGKEEEMELKRKMHELEEKKFESALVQQQESTGQQSVIMQRMLEQQRQQQQQCQEQFQQQIQQMSNFQMMLMQSQQQQQQAMFDFFEKMKGKN